MTGFYNILPKKSIFLAFVAVFSSLLLSPALAAMPNDPNLAFQKQFWTQINAEEAWEIATSTDVVVAVIDIGVDYTHPDLKDNIWTNGGEIPSNGIDDDSNGYIDDIHGWNFIENNAFPRAEAGSGFGDNDTLSHGTAIAGLIGAVGNNAYGVAGINWKIKIMPIRAINSYGVGSYENIRKAVAYAVENGAGVISMSFIGEVPDEEVYDIIQNAYSRGVVTVVAAGNDARLNNDGDLDERPLYPICFDSEDQDNWVLGVTSVDSDDQLSIYANYGRCVDIAAPGESLYSTEIAGRTNNFTGFGGGWQGTSFSAPLVAGTIAMIKGMRPDWTSQELISVLLMSADDISEQNPGFDGKIGYGRLNVGRAIANTKASPAAGSADRICYNESSKIYCYDIAAKAKTYLVDTRGTVRDLDWLGKKYVAAVVYSNFSTRADIYSGRGLLIKSLPVDNSNSRISLFDIGGALEFALASYDAKTKRTNFDFYNMNGVKWSNFSLPGNQLQFQVMSDKLFVASIASGRLVTAVYDFSGRKLAQLYGPAAGSIKVLKVGHLWSKNNYEIAVIATDKAGSYKYIADIESAAFIKERVGFTPEALMLLDKNFDGLQDIFAYRFDGGVFDVFTAKSKYLAPVALPVLR